MDVTIVTLVLDDAVGLARTRASVSAQDWCGLDAEHVIVDGGSQDGSVQLARSWVDEPGTVVVDGPDEGIYDGMNRGLAAARGSWVWYLNAGDALLDPHAAADLIAAAGSSTWAYGGAVPVDADGVRVGPTLIPNLTPRSLRWGEVYVNHQAMVMRRDLLRLIGGFDASYALAGEYHAYLRAAACARPRRVNREVVAFSVGGRSSGPAHAREMARARTEVLQLGPTGRAASRALAEYRIVRHAVPLGRLGPVRRLRDRYLRERHGATPGGW